MEKIRLRPQDVLKSCSAELITNIYRDWYPNDEITNALNLLEGLIVDDINSEIIETLYATKDTQYINLEIGAEIIKTIEERDHKTSTSLIQTAFQKTGSTDLERIRNYGGIINDLFQKYLNILAYAYSYFDDNRSKDIKIRLADLFSTDFSMARLCFLEWRHMMNYDTANALADFIRNNANDKDTIKMAHEPEFYENEFHKVTSTR